MPCASIQDAIVRMGARTVIDLASGMAAMTAFADLKGAGKAVREHCVGSGRHRARTRLPHDDGAAPAMAFLWPAARHRQAAHHDRTATNSYAESGGGRRWCSDELHLQGTRNSWATITRCWAGMFWPNGACPIPCPDRGLAPPTRARTYQEGGPVAVLVAVLRIADVIDTLGLSDKPTDGVALKTPGRRPGRDSAAAFGEKDIVATVFRGVRASRVRPS